MGAEAKVDTSDGKNIGSKSKCILEELKKLQAKLLCCKRAVNREQRRKEKNKENKTLGQNLKNII
jgi:hypothetical protein